MVVIPAICTICGTAFGVNDVIGGSGRVTLIDFEVGPCPVCGGWGRVPDGHYDLVGDGIQAVWSSIANTDDLRRLDALLHQAMEQELSRDEVAQKIEEADPEFGPLADYVRRHPELALLVAIISILLNTLGSGTPDVNVTVNLNEPPSAEQVIEQFPAAGSSETKQRPFTKTPKPGRNEPCPCGSGKKFKNCHGWPGAFTERP